MDVCAIAMGVAFALIWASAFTAGRIIVTDAPPLTALAIRFLISGALGIAIAARLGQSWKLTRTQWTATIVFGLCHNALCLGLNFVAMQTVEASLAAIIASTMPLVVALGGWFALGERITALGAAGLMSGVAGVAIVMGSRFTAGADAYGVILCSVGVVSLAVATMTVRGASSGGNLLMVVGLQSLVGSAALGLIAVPAETWTVNWTWSMGSALVYSALIPGLAATWLWFLLVNRIGATRAATFHFLSPPFGVAVAALILGEGMSLQDALGVAVIALGILAVQLSRRMAR